MAIKKNRQIVVWCLGLLVFSTALLFAQDEHPTFDELAQTEAARLYVSKQYAKALQEFEKLEAEHPQSALIKRYVAKLYDILRRREEAVQKLQEVISIQSDDFIARQMLADIYVKQGAFDQALKGYQFIYENDHSEKYRPHAEKRINEINAMQYASSQRGAGALSIDELIKSEAAQAFTRGEFEKAVTEFDIILQKYPQDSLVHRLKGISFLRLGRYQEAITVLENALAFSPDNAAVHYYLGNTFEAMGQVEKAREEYRWVINRGDAEYKAQAEKAILQTLKPEKRPQKRWKLQATAAYEFDTNATYKSNDDNFTQAGDQNSGRYKSLVFGNYNFLKKKRLSFTLDGFYVQNISNDFPRLNTYTFGSGVSGLYTFSVLNRPSAFSIRDGFTYTLLKNKFFLFSNSLLGRFIIQMHPKIRTSISYNFQVNEYDASGLNPDLTDRDGFGHVATFSNTFYMNRAKTFYFSADYYFERHTTEGNNFIRNVNGGELRTHFPIALKFEGDVNFEFKDANYLKYGSTPPKRRDDVFTLTSKLSYPLTDALTLTGSYVFEDSRAKNNLFEYTKHVFGVELGFAY